MSCTLLSVLGGPEQLTVMGFVFWFIGVGITEMPVWLVCDCVKRVCEFYKVIDHLVCWLVIVYSVFLALIVISQW